MSKVFVISDTHFNHAGVLNVPGRKEMFTGCDIVEHDERLIENWNSVVTKRDTVIHLGDVGYDRPSGYFTHGIYPRLAGRKIVVGGNHDTPEILSVFDKVNGAITRSVSGWSVCLTHIPIHPQEAYWDLNIHGHLHANRVWKYANNPMEGKNRNEADPRYLCVSVEHTNFAPVDLHVLVEDHMEKWGKAIEKYPRPRRRRK